MKNLLKEIEAQDSVQGNMCLFLDCVHLHVCMCLIFKARQRIQESVNLQVELTLHCVQMVVLTFETI